MMIKAYYCYNKKSKHKEFVYTVKSGFEKFFGGLFQCVIKEGEGVGLEEMIGSDMILLFITEDFYDSECVQKEMYIVQKAIKDTGREDIIIFALVPKMIPRLHKFGYLAPKVTRNLCRKYPLIESSVIIPMKLSHNSYRVYQEIFWRSLFGCAKNGNIYCKQFLSGMRGITW